MHYFIMRMVIGVLVVELNKFMSNVLGFQTQRVKGNTTTKAPLCNRLTPDSKAVFTPEMCEDA